MEENKNNFENTEEIMTDKPEKSTEPEQEHVEECSENKTGINETDSVEAGSNVMNIPESESEKEDTSYSYGERVGSGMAYQMNGNRYEEEMDTTPLTMGDWLLTLLAAFIPCCGGIILYCYWAFSRKGNLHRRNFCRAALIVQAVLIVLLIIFFVLVVVIGSVSYGTTTGGYYYYGY